MAWNWPSTQWHLNLNSFYFQSLCLAKTSHPSWLCLDSDPFVTEQWIQMVVEHVIDESWCEVPCQIASLFCKQVGGIWPNYNPQRWISSGSFHVESSARYAHRFCINIRSFARATYCDVLFDLNSAGPSSWDWWSCNPVHLRRWITFLSDASASQVSLVKGSCHIAQWIVLRCLKNEKKQIL